LIYIPKTGSKEQGVKVSCCLMGKYGFLRVGEGGIALFLNGASS
jgi:hypothetical protein